MKRSLPLVVLSMTLDFPLRNLRIDCDLVVNASADFGPWTGNFGRWTNRLGKLALTDDKRQGKLGPAIRCLSSPFGQ